MPGAFLALAATVASAERRVELSVPDMHCATCPLTIKKNLERLDGVQVESASLETGRVIVHVPDALPDEALLKAVRNAGYTPTLTAAQEPQP